MLKEDDKQVFQAIFQRLGEIDVRDTVIEEVLDKHRRQSVAANLAMAALSVTEGKGDEDLVKWLNEYQEASTVAGAKDNFVSSDIQSLYQEVYRETGLRWRLSTLNKTLGSLRKGDFGFITARPETGKTTFLTSEASCFLDTVAQPIIHYNNEEQGGKVMFRYYQAIFGVDMTTLIARLGEYRDAFDRRYKGKLLIYDAALIDRHDVERINKQYEPGLIILDQLDKIKGFKGDKKVDELTAAYQWAREQAKTYCPVIGVCQAGATAENKKYLSMDDIAESKTGKAGEADWILGIGKVHDDHNPNKRYLSILKNKLTGDEDTIEELRHGKVEVEICPTIARYGDLVL